MKINKKYIIPLISIFLLLLLMLIFNFKSVGKRPELTSLSKSVANPGDTITLMGNYFGGEISRGRVYINGNMIYKDFIKSWSNKEITITLTDDFKSGMITVINMFGESSPYLITSFKDVPIIDDKRSAIGVPNIEFAEYLDSSNLKIKLIGNFLGTKDAFNEIKIGSIKGEELVIDNFNIVSWNDNEVIFYLSYAITDLLITISHRSDISNQYSLHNDNVPAISYNLTNTKRYLVEQNITIKDVISLNNSFIKLFIPTVYIGMNQKRDFVDIGNGKYNVLSRTVDYIIPVNETGFKSEIILKSEVDIRSIETTIRTDLIGRTYDISSPHYIKGYQETPNVELSTDLKGTAIWLVRNENNRYNQVNIIMNWLLKNINVTDDASDNATLGFKNRTVSDYGIINLTVSMLRSIGIPSRVISGIKEDDTWVNYKWIEFYLPDGGWIPLDLIKIKEDPEYKIGILENNRICFTKGVTFIDYVDNKFDPDFYALQNSTSNFEGNIEHYSALWHNVNVK